MAAGARASDTHPVPRPDPGRGTAPRRGRTLGGRTLLVTVAVGLVLLVVVRALVAQSFYVPSGSMEPTVEPGERLVVNKLVRADDLRRGDVVVFDGTTTFAAADRTPTAARGAVGEALSSAASALGIDLGEQDFLKRVVGLPGDHVVCCSPEGRLVVNGVAVTETYVPRGAKASDVTFDVTVPAGRMWVLGDNRPLSSDSRAHLGDPGGGMVPIDDVIGRASVIYWPLSRAGGVPGSGALRSVPAPTGGGS